MNVDMYAQNVETPSAVPPMSRQRVRLERRAQRRANRGYWPAGLGLLVLGTLFLLQNAGVPIPGQQIWGMFFYLLAVGAVFIAVNRYTAAGAHFTRIVSSATSVVVLFAFIGTVLAYNLSWNFLWPMLLIIPGAMAVIAAATSDEPGEDH